MSKFAIITGASSGLGEEFAKQLAQQGYDLLLIARRQEKLEALAKTLTTKVHVLPLDLTSDKAEQKVIQYLHEHQLQPTLLINNAGFGQFDEALEVRETTHFEMLNLNVKALTALTLSVATLMKQARVGAILNVASIAAFCPCPYLSVYSASKAYVLALSENLDLELKQYGIRVCALCPGPVPTNFWEVAGVSHTESFKCFMTEPKAVVASALNALEKDKSIVYPGFFNNLLYFLVKLLPRCFSQKISLIVLKEIFKKIKKI